MKELDALSNQITTRVKEEGQRKVAKKEQELAEILEENRVRLVEQQKVQKTAIETRSKNDYSRQVQSLANEKRNRILAEKQNILTAVYEEAVEKMGNWDAERFQSFVQAVLRKFDKNDLKIIPGEKTNAHFTDAFKTTLKEEFSGMTVASETVSNKAGFIVEVGGIDYNFLFDQVVAEIKNDFSSKLASLAFQKNE